MCADTAPAARLLGVPADALDAALRYRLVHSGRGSMYQVVLLSLIHI